MIRNQGRISGSRGGLCLWMRISWAFALAAWFLTGAAGATEGWLTDYEMALEAAREGQKPVLAFFTGSDWCPHCRTLEEKVLKTETFRAWADGRLVLLTVDMPQKGLSTEERAARSRVCIKYGVRTFPSVVLISPDGNQITSQTGYLGQAADAWVTSLDGHLPAREIGENTVAASLDDAVETAREERRPILVVVSSPSDATSKTRMASLIKDPEFGAFARENFVVAAVPGAGEATGGSPEALDSLLGGDGVAGEGVEVIVTDDGQTPLYTESGCQPPQRIVSGLRRFLAARQATRR